MQWNLEQVERTLLQRRRSGDDLHRGLVDDGGILGDGADVGEQRLKPPERGVRLPNRILFGETESCLGKRNPVWGNGVLSGEIKSCPGKQSPV